MRQLILALALFSITSVTYAAAGDPVLPVGRLIKDKLTTSDRPSDSGGFSKDYKLTLPANQIVIISAKSDDFDAQLRLFTAKGELLSQNDDRESDSEERSNNPLIMTSVSKGGDYTLRVSAYSSSCCSSDENDGKPAGTGDYTVKVMTMTDE